jgi:hypothetical protein
MSWGEIYNTSWWGVALDTARTVKARPDFFGSQLNLLTSEQPNLVTNGTFDTDSDWSLGTGWSIEDGKAYRGAEASGSNLQQNNIFTIGKKYKVTLDVLENIGINKVFIGSGTGFTLSGTGTQTFIGNCTNNTILYIQASNHNSEVKIDNVSVQVARAELDQIEAKKCLADWIHTTALKDLNN